MGDLHYDVRIACPPAAAASHVRSYIEHAQLAADHSLDGESAQFNMRLGKPALVALGMQADDRGVHVAMRPIRDGDPAISRYRVRWSPERRGPHTLFFGELAVEGTEDESDAFGLRLDGRFEIPHDCAPLRTEHGSPERIARATASALLEQIRSFVLLEEDTARTRGAAHTNGVSHGYAG